jgi:hypothetical protein
MAAKRAGNIAGLHVGDFSFFDAELVKNGAGRGVIGAADAAHAEFLASQIFHPFDLVGDKKHVGKAIGSARNQHGAGPLQVAGDHLRKLPRGRSGVSPETRAAIASGAPTSSTKSTSSPCLANRPRSLAVQTVAWVGAITVYATRKFLHLCLCNGARPRVR